PLTTFDVHFESMPTRPAAVPRHRSSAISTNPSNKHLPMPSGELYAWIATESKASRQIRRVLLDEKGLSQDQVKAVGYWKLDDSDEE
ncbi:SIP domain-containing protein, partial [Pseudomonas sp. GW460-R15]|uniref:SIP domain-containing protein n=1 Tax=Pseudomonas sp. GW460-R15 TaxID=2075557 RepID=UPI002115A27A